MNNLRSLKPIGLERGGNHGGDRAPNVRATLAIGLAVMRKADPSLEVELLPSFRNDSHSSVRRQHVKESQTAIAACNAAIAQSRIGTRRSLS